MGFEFGEDESVDLVFDPGGIFDFGEGGACGFREGPVVAPFGPFVDPVGEDFDLRGVERSFFDDGRHVIVGIGSGDAFDEEGFGGVAWDDGEAGIAAFDGEFSLVEAEVGLDAGFVGAMAGVAVVREDGLDLGGEVDFGSKGESEGEGQGKDEGAHAEWRIRRDASFFYVR